jgi:DNA polymerase III delta prime subunit
MKLASDYYGTKTGIEILFTIADIYEIQQRAIYQYFQNSKSFYSYSSKQKQEIRVETIRRIIEKYKSLLDTKKIFSEQDSDKLYWKKRLGIYNQILKSTPGDYRKSDVLFEKGRVLWDMAQRNNDNKLYEDAVNIFKEISRVKKSEGDFIFKSTYESILPLLNDAISGNGAKNFTARNNISMLLMGRLNQHLENKKKREDRLLWKK